MIVSGLMNVPDGWIPLSDHKLSIKRSEDWQLMQQARQSRASHCTGIFEANVFWETTPLGGPPGFLLVCVMVETWYMGHGRNYSLFLCRNTKLV